LNITALKAGDLGLLPIAENILFENPISGRQQGAENFRAFLSGFLPAIKDAKIHRCICDGEYIAAHWEVDSVFGIISILEMFRIQGGLITESHSFFDPRPVRGG